MAQVTVAQIKVRDDYVGLSVANKALVDTALAAVALAFKGSVVTDKDGQQDNVKSLFEEAINQQVIA